MMEYVAVFLGMLLIIIGIIGCVLPVLPGLPLSWLGLLLPYLLPQLPVNYPLLIITFIIMVIISVFDYLIPTKGVRYFGGSRYSIWGTNIGLLVGFFFMPLGVVIGPFLGALLGELMFKNSDFKKASKVALGALLGFLGGTFIKMIVGLSFLLLYGYVILSNSHILFA